MAVTWVDQADRSIATIGDIKIRAINKPRRTGDLTPYLSSSGTPGWRAARYATLGDCKAAAEAELSRWAAAFATAFGAVSTPVYSAPEPPTNVVGVAGDASVALTWYAPESDGGKPVTSYVVTLDTGDAVTYTMTGATAATVTGLSNNTAYSFVVYAVNEVGTSTRSTPPSAAVTPVSATPTAVPGAPAIPTPFGGAANPISQYSGQAVVSWTLTDFGFPATITGFEIAATPAAPSGTHSWTAGTDWFNVFTDLTPGQSYTFKVRAQNATGWGSWSADSAAVTPGTALVPFETDEFTGSTLNARWTEVDPLGDGTVTVASGVLNLAVPTGGSKNHDNWPDTTPVNRTLRIVQNCGTGDWTVETKILNADANDAKFGGFLLQADANNFVRFDWDGDHGTSIHLYVAVWDNTGSFKQKLDAAISSDAVQWMRVEKVGTQYTASTSTDGQTFTQRVSFAWTPAPTLIGLNCGSSNTSTAYTAQFEYFRRVTGGTTAAAPAAPTNVSASSLDTGAYVSWTPGFNGGAAVSSYRIREATPSAGAHTATIDGEAATSGTVMGLSNGTPYTFTVSALNSIGRGPESTASNSVTPATVVSPTSRPVQGVTTGPRAATTSTYAGSSPPPGTYNRVLFTNASVSVQLGTYNFTDCIFAHDLRIEVLGGPTVNMDHCRTGYVAMACPFTGTWQYCDGGNIKLIKTVGNAWWGNPGQGDWVNLTMLGCYYTWTSPHYDGTNENVKHNNCFQVENGYPRGCTFRYCEFHVNATDATSISTDCMTLTGDHHTVDTCWFTCTAFPGNNTIASALYFTAYDERTNPGIPAANKIPPIPNGNTLINSWFSPGINSTLVLNTLPPDTISGNKNYPSGTPL